MPIVKRLVEFAREVTGPGLDPSWSLDVPDEADTIWRMGCMLGVDDRAIEAVRAESVQRNGLRPVGRV